MTKAKTISKEEQEFLAAEAAKKTQYSTPKMAQLAINSDKVDDEGKKIEPDTWYIRGEKQYSDTVSFRPLRYKQKFIRMVQAADKSWKTDNESIMVEGFEPAYDAKGGVGCGRIIGSLPEHWTKEQQVANFKKAGIYGFLFGLVTFPGSKPTLVNFRCPPAKTKPVREALSKRVIGLIPFYKLAYNMNLHTKKGEKFVTLDMVPDLNTEHDDFREILPYIKEIDAYIEAHNANIMKRRENIITTMKAQSLGNEIMTKATEFDDEVPF